MPTEEKTVKKSKAVSVRDVATLMVLPGNSLITLPEVAALGKISLRFVVAQRTLGRGPRVVKLGRSVRCSVQDALTWLNSSCERAA